MPAHVGTGHAGKAAASSHRVRKKDSWGEGTVWILRLKYTKISGAGVSKDIM